MTTAFKNIITVQSVKLYPWQKDVALSIFDHWKGTIHTVKSKRQVGKSIMLEQILLKTATERKSSESFVVSPTNAQATKIFNELLKALDEGLRYFSREESIGVILYIIYDS